MTDLGFATTSRVGHSRLRAFVAVIVALAVLGGGGGFLAWKSQEVLADVFVTPDYPGPGSGEVVIEVESGDTASTIGERLASEDVVKSAEAFRRAAKRDDRSREIQPGHYRLREKMAGAQALTMLLDSEARIYEKVTVPEGMRLRAAMRLLSDETGIAHQEFTEVLDDGSELELPAYADGEAEGFLFPATYEVDPDVTAAELLQQMADRFNRAASELDLRDRAERLGRTPREIVIVASLIEKEARHPDDFNKVARVIYNRLAQDMPLQFDSTVHYAVNASGRVSTTPKQRRTDDKHNTYRYKGLPPGPIAAPGKQALEAALSPERGDWLYFVTTDPDTGATKFAVTQKQHAKNAKEFQQWCRNNKDRC